VYQVQATLVRLRSVALPQVLVAGPGLLALGICAYRLTLPHTFAGVHGADDGVYLGAALRLAHGVVPYRDFAFVQPPGIAWLMAPLGIFGDSRDAMAAARIVTALVAGLNASLAAFVLRDRGRVAMLAAGLVLAAFPLAVSADHTLTLEPYLVLFCLLGTVTMFSAGELANSRRILWAGALFGLAGAVKAWAIFPAVAALCICVPLWRSAVRPFVSGLVLGFGLPSLPFLVLAPRNAVHDVVVAQLNRSTSGQGFQSVGERLELILGVGTPASAEANTRLAWSVALVLGGLVVEVYLVSAVKSRLEWFVLGATALVFAYMLFVVKDFYDYYSYLTAAFGALLLGVCAAELADGIRGASRLIGDSAGRIAAGAVPAGVIVAATLMLLSGTHYARVFLRGAYDPATTIDSHVSKGSCVVFDQVGTLIDSNRFFSSRPGCPALVDAFGLWLTDNHGIPPPAQPTSEKFVAKWRSWLERADYAVFAVPHTNYVPWTTDLTAWFESNYRLVASAPQVYVYRHVAQARSR
jgi:alpha-1,2-mannosyltransferase